MRRSTAKKAKAARRILATRLEGKRSKKIGLPPGTLVHVGEEFIEKSKISVIDYDETSCREKEIMNVSDLAPFKDGRTTTWINVDGIHDVTSVEALGELFHLHPLVLEDIVNATQRPKIEDAGDYLFIVLKVLDYNEESDEITLTQLSLVLGSEVLLSFQERQGDLFNPVRERLKGGNVRIRKSGADYLAYSLIDTVVDNYFAILEKLSEKMEVLEEELVKNPGRETLQGIHRMKTDMIYLRRSIWPLREVVNTLGRGESALIKDSTLPYLRDVYDHTIHAVDTLETFRDIVSGMLDIYLSSVSNRLNEIMKVLTIIATIFIPLTFLSGWYGMNFKDMPELAWRWGYPMVIGIALAVATTMLIYFWRKKWL
jgi:magnesium transporter